MCCAAWMDGLMDGTRHSSCASRNQCQPFNTATGAEKEGEGAEDQKSLEDKEAADKEAEKEDPEDGGQEVAGGEDQQAPEEEKEAPEEGAGGQGTQGSGCSMAIFWVIIPKGYLALQMHWVGGCALLSMGLRSLPAVHRFK